MDRIRRIEDVIIPDGVLLLEAVMEDNGVVDIDNEEQDKLVSYSKIIKVGDGVKKFSEGDIVFELVSRPMLTFKFKDKGYILAFEHSIGIGTKPENVDFDSKIDLSI